jgi:hypothetical protein
MPIKVEIRGPMFSPTAAKVTQEELREGIDGAIARLRDAIASKAKVATGDMKAGIKVVDRRSGAAVVASKSYSIPVDQGRSPGWLNKPGARRLAAWAELVLGLSSQEARRAAYAITVTNSRSGIPADHFFYRTFDQMQSQLNSQMANIPGQIVARLS